MGLRSGQWWDHPLQGVPQCHRKGQGRSRQEHCPLIRDRFDFTIVFSLLGNSMNFEIHSLFFLKIYQSEKLIIQMIQSLGIYLMV